MQPRRKLTDLELKAGLGVAGSNTYGESPPFIGRITQPQKLAFIIEFFQLGLIFSRVQTTE